MQRLLKWKNEIDYLGLVYRPSNNWTLKIPSIRQPYYRHEKSGFLMGEGGEGA